MERIQFEQFYSWFKGYVSGFYTGDPNINMNIDLKEKHTYRVCENIVMIGKSINMNAEDLILAETIGLFHDIGRFEQFKKYQTFQDAKSENHAELGIKVLEETKVLDILLTEETELIAAAIKYHNYCELPKEVNPKHELFCKLIRDADKLDIYKVLTDYYTERRSNPNKALEVHKDSLEYTESIFKNVLEHRNIPYENIRTQNDFRLVQLGWIFDINFAYSLKIIKEQGYIDKFMCYLPSTDKMREVHNNILHYMDSKKLDT